MKSIALAATLVCGLFVLGQQHETSANFHWNSHKWQELSRKQSISRRNLSSSLKAQLIELILEQMRGDEPENEIPSEKDSLKLAGETRIEFVDLTGHGRNEIIAQAAGEGSACSPTGNCPLWVLQRQGHSYRVILAADSVQTFTIQPTRTSGLNDLVLGMHGSATDAMLTLHKFNGSRYENVACYEANWEIVDKQGEAHHLKEPRITPCE